MQPITTLKVSSNPEKSFLLPSPCCIPRQALICVLSLYISLHFLKLCVNGIMLYVFFSGFFHVAGVI